MERLVTIMLILLSVLAIYTMLDMQRIVVRKYRIKGKDTLRIVQLSDIHKKTFGKDDRRLIDLVEKNSPDVLVITGDLVSRNQQDTSQIENLVKEVCKLTEVYFIYGNHEMDMDEGTLRQMVKRLEGFGATLLDDQSAKVAENTFLWGLTLPIECYHDGNHGYKDVHSYSPSDLPNSLESLATQSLTNGRDFNILLVHNPLFFETYAQLDVDLVLSGHVHGGVIRLPVLNVGLLSPERKILPKYHGGLYQLNGKTMLVSRGLGKLRIFNPPEISIIDIEKSKEYL